MPFQRPGFQYPGFQITRFGPAEATLPSLSCSGTGIVEVIGSAAATLPKLTLAGEAVAPELGHFQFSARYKHFWARGKRLYHFWADYYGPALGTAEAALPSLTLDASGAHGVAGAIAATLPRITAEGEGSLVIDGAFDATLPNITASGAGTQGVEGDLDATLPILFADIEGVIFAPGTVFGSIDATLPSLVAEGTIVVPRRRGGGHHDLPDEFYFRIPHRQRIEKKPPVDGKFAATLPSLIASGSGTYETFSDAELLEVWRWRRSKLKRAA